MVRATLLGNICPETQLTPVIITLVRGSRPSAISTVARRTHLSQTRSTRIRICVGHPLTIVSSAVVAHPQPQLIKITTKLLKIAKMGRKLKIFQIQTSVSTPSPSLLLPPHADTSLVTPTRSIRIRTRLHRTCAANKASTSL